MSRESIDASTLRGWLERGQDVTVVDVRRAEDRAGWSIPGSVGFDAYDRLRSGDPGVMDGLDVPGDGPVVTVCGAGRSSAVAAERLRERGIEALTLEGGMKAWGLAWNTAEVELAGAGVLQVRRTGKGCLSYLVGSGGEAAVIDASVAPEVYLDLAAGRGWRIVHVLDTHVHADHLSRSRVLAGLTGATLHMPEEARVSYPFSPMGEGGEVCVGGTALLGMATPGHTPESISLQIDEASGAALFTGDTLFLSAVGRPDLGAEAEEVQKKARALHASLRRIVALGPSTLVLPGHTGEPVPFDGRPIAAALSEVLQSTPLLREDEDIFVERLTGGAAPAPENHERIADLNKSGEWPGDDPAELEAGANRCAAG